MDTPDTKTEDYVDREIYSQFVLEVEIVIDRIIELLEVVKDNYNLHNIQEIFRHLHNVKGTASFLTFDAIVKICHESENVVTSFMQDVNKNDIESFSQNITEKLDELYLCLIQIKQGSFPFVAEKSKDTFVLSDGNVGNEKYKPLVKTTQQNQKTVAHNAFSMNSKSDEMFVSISIKKLDELFNKTNEILVKSEQFSQKIINKLEVSSSFLQKFDESLVKHMLNLQNSILGLRTENIGIMLKRVAVLSKKFALELEKPINFLIDANNVIIDKAIIDKLQNPLVHLVRNAIDHGFTKNHSKERLDQKLVSTVVIRAEQNGEYLFITIEDDGKGIDTDKIRQVCLDRNLISQTKLNKLSDQEIINLIFLPNFSTKDIVDSVSGRGVGMDSIKNVVEQIHGRIEVNSVVTKGTVFTIKVPNIYMLTNAIGIEVCSNIYYIAAKKIQQIIAVEDDSIQHVGKLAYVRHQQQVFPLYDLSEWLLNLSTTLIYAKKKETCVDKKFNKKKVIILECNVSSTSQPNIRLIAVCIDKMPIQQDILVKPLTKHTDGILGFVGNIKQDKGNLSLVLNVDALPFILGEFVS